MTSQQRTLELLERAEQTTTTCPACGLPTVVAVHDGHLWLECASHDRSVPLVRRLLSLGPVGGHMRLDLEAAA